MEDYKVKQIWPNHADHISYYNEKYLQKMFDEETVIAQPKYDGERMLIHINKGEVYCTSRRFSKKTGRFMENQEKLPILAEKLKHLNLDYTVLDCECYAKDWSTIVGILHSLPERAVELQKENAAKFAVFDCLFINGRDIRESAYLSRLAQANIVVNSIRYENLHMIEIMNENDVKHNNTLFNKIKSKEEWQKYMNDALDNGFEGIVLKSIDRKYYDKGASLKCKKFETVDCVITGYQEGRGKYENQVGALEIGYYNPDKDEFVKISNVNCGTDTERLEVSNNRDKCLHTVVEVKCQEITNRSLRHPVFVRFRDDKDYTMVTRDTIFKEVE